MAKTNKRSEKEEKAVEEAPRDKATDEEDGSAMEQNEDLAEVPADANENEDADETREEPKEPPSDDNDPPAATTAADVDAQTHKDLIATSAPAPPLEIALAAELRRQTAVVARLQSELSKLQNFVSKRKQTYKRKRKDDEAPRKSLSGYNMFVRERFAKLAEENKKALESGDTTRQMERVPPHEKVAEAGRAWKALSKEEKAKYDAL